MRTQIRTNASRRRGMAMLYAVFAAFAAATMVSVMLTLSLSGNRSANVKRNSGQARYLAEGAIEAAKRDVATALANWSPVPAVGTVTIAGTQVNYTVTPTGFAAIDTDPAGIQTLLTGFEIEARARVRGNQATAHRLINAEATPVFQFAVFYTDDLEINPGPSMTLGGRVHTNGDMYMNCGGTLTVNTNYLRAVGKMYRHRKDDPSVSNGTVSIRNWVANPYDPGESYDFVDMLSKSQLAALGVASTSGYDSNFDKGFDQNGDGDFDDPMDVPPWDAGALAYWSQILGYTGGSGYTVRSSAHGVQRAAVPFIGSIKMFEPKSGGDYVWDAGAGEYVAAAPGTGTHARGYYHSQADLSIITYDDGTMRAFDSTGTDISGSLPGVFTGKTMYDARQAGGGPGNVQVTEIDLEVLRTLGKFPANGLLYAAHYDAGTGTNAKGVRLVNGAELAGKLTVVSENSIYVQGDFNTVNKQGAAAIADGVNLLSNAWDDTKGDGTGLPTASNTTYNLAIITGNQSTVGNQYNGGLENLPRFHEKWSGKNCVIRGSFVNTWNSEYATGGWQYGGDRYQAPNRMWSYDDDFNLVANLPPFTPMAVTAVDVAVW